MAKAEAAERALRLLSSSRQDDTTIPLLKENKENSEGRKWKINILKWLLITSLYFSFLKGCFHIFWDKQTRQPLSAHVRAELKGKPVRWLKVMWFLLWADGALSWNKVVGQWRATESLKQNGHSVSCSTCSDAVHSAVSASLPPSFVPSLPPCLPPFSRGRYRRTCTSLLRYKVSFHLLTEVTGFPCIQHRGKRTHWGRIVPDYLRGGCSLSMQHGEGQEAVGGFYQDLIWL